MNNEALNYWYPVSIHSDEGESKCRWKYFKGIEFTDPFFDETILRASSLENNSQPYKIISDLSVLPKWSETSDNLEPTLFIFHVSRCGSTLLTQLLNLNDKHLVLSEVPFIDDILKQLSIEEWLVDTKYQQILKATIKLYARKQNRNQNKLFIKLDSWHFYYLPLFRKLYSNIPFLFLYRNPNEVLLSHQKNRGMHAVPGLINDKILGIQIIHDDIVDFDLHLIKVFESYFKSMINTLQNDKLVILANYNEGLEKIIDKISKMIYLDLNEHYRNKIAERSLYHSKFPDQHFKEELPQQTPASNLSQVFILYNKLEKFRSLQAINEGLMFNTKLR